MQDFPFFPEQASTMASQIDSIYFTLIGLSLVFAIPVAGLIIFFAARYRKGTPVNRSKQITESFKLEFTWSFIPFLLAMGIFGWSAMVFYNIKTPPADALEIYVVGKQWMWKTQHPTGKSEINQLHIPAGQRVKLIMTSQDVIHSFYIPAFRLKQDVLPGRYTTMWFEATKTGEYHLFCAEYCGTEHAQMIGNVVVMEPAEYQNWLSGSEAGESMAVAGQRLFEQQGCDSCHSGEDGARGPALTGIFGTDVLLDDGRTITVDEAYIRESIVNPQAKIVSGYGPIMPTYEGQISEEGILQLVAYIKSLETSQ